ncbi:MAG: ribosome recycling factor [Clostridiales Family XIII bacterium]|jgi:ribosome recycling factor|nr:ribosome recycling factor [Clostridiales Family XIII bacterium]
MNTQGKDIQEVLDDKIKKTITILKENLNTVRAGRSNPALLDKVTVDYYGTPTPLKSIANITVPDPRSLAILPFDPKSLHEIEKAISAADIGINPSNDGKMLRLQIPSLTEERRRDLTKLVRKFGEDAKVAIRNERRDANEHLKKQEKSGDLTEDDLKTEEKSVQKKTDEAIEMIDQIVSSKEAEILEV